MKLPSRSLPSLLFLCLIVCAHPRHGFAQKAEKSAPGWGSEWTDAVTVDELAAQKFVQAYTRLVERKKFPEAAQLCDAWIKDHPKQPKPYAMRALVKAQLKQLEAAEQDATQSCDLATKGKSAAQGPILQLRSMIRTQRTNYAGAAQDLQGALNENPNDAEMLNNLAWLRATCPTDDVRNGREAVKLAQKALTMNPNHRYAVVYTLAAAYAEAGDFPKAIQTEKSALMEAQQDRDKNSKTARMMKEGLERMRLFEQGKPYHHALGQD